LHASAAKDFSAWYVLVLTVLERNDADVNGGLSVVLAMYPPWLLDESISLLNDESVSMVMASGDADFRHTMGSGSFMNRNSRFVAWNHGTY